MLARELLDEPRTSANVDVEEAVRLARHPRRLERVLVRGARRERLPRVLDRRDPGRQIGNDELSVDVGVMDGNLAEAQGARRRAGDRAVAGTNAEVGAEAVDDPVERRAAADTGLRLGD